MRLISAGSKVQILSGPPLCPSVIFFRFTAKSKSLELSECVTTATMRDGGVAPPRKNLTAVSENQREELERFLTWICHTKTIKAVSTPVTTAPSPASIVRRNVCRSRILRQWRAASNSIAPAPPSAPRRRVSWQVAPSSRGVFAASAQKSARHAVMNAESTRHNTARIAREPVVIVQRNAAKWQLRKRDVAPAPGRLLDAAKLEKPA